MTRAHDRHNPDLLRLIPPSARTLIEVGCSSGALAREYKKGNPGCHYLGLEKVGAYADLAQRHCDEVLVADVEALDEAFFAAQAGRECWVFGDVLEHLIDPWQVLRRVRAVIPPQGAVVACVPNAQHWSVIARLAGGMFRYEDSGLLDRTHLRWFTRQTLFELFHDTGFRVEIASARVFDEPSRQAVLPWIGQLARATGWDPAQAVKDAEVFQFVLRALPD